MEKVTKLKYKDMLRALRVNKDDAVFVLHKTNCNNCKKFIKNEFHAINSNGLKLVQVNIGRRKDTQELEELLQISKLPNLPLVIVMQNGLFDHLKKPTLHSIHQKIKDMRKGSGYEHKSLKDMQEILSTPCHKKKLLDPLGIEANVARECGRDGDTRGVLMDLPTVMARNSLVMFKSECVRIVAIFSPMFTPSWWACPFLATWASTRWIW